jgi:transcriptional regulator with XRE-family HTH domain
MRQYNHSNQQPHKPLGRFLKTMRQRLQESLGETSGAVEIAVEQLDRFERGAELPSEDILMLLISHFNLPDDEALQAWDLAGYDSRMPPFVDNGRESNDRQGQGPEFNAKHPMQVMLLALDNRILYTNGAEIVTDDSGIVVSFTQSDGGQHAPYPVSKVGMSHAQAEELLQTLQRALLHKKYRSGPKELPPQASKS